MTPTSLADSPQRADIVALDAAHAAVVAAEARRIAARDFRDAAIAEADAATNAYYETVLSYRSLLAETEAKYAAAAARAGVSS